MFAQTKWPLVPTLPDNDTVQGVPQPVPEANDDEDADDVDPAPRYDLQVMDYKLTLLHTFAKKLSKVPVANFFISDYLNVYQFDDGSSAPYHKFLCRKLIDVSGLGVYYLSVNDKNRSPCLRGYHFLDVEVMFTDAELKCTSDVTAIFQNAHGSLKAFHLTVDMFASYQSTFQQPMNDRVITKFGLQPDGIFVAGNCCYGMGRFYTLKEKNIEIVPQFFEQQLMPIPRSHYAKHIIIPFPHVRYALAVEFWNKTIPSFFANNLVQARAVMCIAAMGLHVDRFWDGQTGLGHGFPIAWVYSLMPNTGKTEACLNAHSMLGFGHRGLVAGDVTKAALFERVSQQCGLTTIVDDVVVSGDSRMYSQIVRALYDQTTRMVMGKERTPQSSVIFTVRSTTIPFTTVHLPTCATLSSKVGIGPMPKGCMKYGSFDSS